LTNLIKCLYLDTQQLPITVLRTEIGQADRYPLLIVLRFFFWPNSSVLLKKG